MRHYPLFTFTCALALVALASCGADHRATNEAEGGTAVENSTLTKLNLTSNAFQNAGPIPAQCTCDGADQSPALSWGEPPPGTKSFVIIVDDPDAPSGTFRHWGAYDIPASTRSIATGQTIGSQAINDFGKTGYGGPCPPKGHGPHHYRFKLLALDVDKLGVQSNPKIVDLERAANPHTIGRGEVVGIYERR